MLAILHGKAVNKKYKSKISGLENELVSNHTEIISLINNNQELESMIQSVARHYAKGIDDADIKNKLA